MHKHGMKIVQRQVKSIYNKRSAARRVAAVDGFLLALEVAFGTHHQDLSLDVSFERISDSCENPLDAAIKYLGNDVRIDGLHELKDWTATLRHNLVRMMPGELSEEGQDELLDTFIILLLGACKGRAYGWRIEANSADGKYFHCWWEMYLFPTADGLYLLYCSIDD